MNAIIIIQIPTTWNQRKEYYKGPNHSFAQDERMYWLEGDTIEAINS
jgi:hypothetical protein